MNGYRITAVTLLLGALVGALGSTGLWMSEAIAATAWSAAYLPQPPESGNGHRAYGVSCVSADFCVAVGDNWSLEVHTAVTLAERWNGNAWAPMETPNPTGLDEGWKHNWYAHLRGVSCASTDACVAVGHYRNEEHDEEPQPLAERWNGSEWTMTVAPLPAGAVAGRLDGISCFSATECVAVGRSWSALGVEEPLALAWNGSKWTVEATISPLLAVGGWLLGVSCSGATTCTAVGSYEMEGGDEAILVERWDGSEWMIQPTPIPEVSPEARLEDVSCPSSTACTAVGYFRSGPTVVTLAEHWDGADWTVQATPTPEGEGTLYGVSCASPTACTAAGTYYVGAEEDHGWKSLVERWAGASWSILEVARLPVPDDWWRESPLNAVSCPQPEACTAVGNALSAPPEGLSPERAFSEHEGPLTPPPPPPPEPPRSLEESSPSGNGIPGFQIGQVRLACHGRLVLSLVAEGAGTFDADASARSSRRGGSKGKRPHRSSCNAGRISHRKARLHWQRSFGYGKASTGVERPGSVELTISPSPRARRAIEWGKSLWIEVMVTFRSARGQPISRRTEFIALRGQA
jgi:hypothetical protein